MKNFIKKPFLLKNLLWLLAIFSIVSMIVPFVIKESSFIKETSLLEKFTFIITALAFLVGATAIILQKMAMKQQEKDSKKAEESLKEQIKLQKEAMEKQEIIGAWQLITTRACGNSGKKEAIELLASKGVPLSGIDLSAKTHGGPVYLAGLFKDFKGDRSKIILNSANFSGAVLKNANFSEAILAGVDFSDSYLSFSTFKSCNLTGIKFNKAELSYAKFIDSDLSLADFSDSEYIGTAEFKDIYCSKYVNINFPKNLPQEYEFELDERVDENGKPIYPKGDPTYLFIKLVELKI